MRQRFSKGVYWRRSSNGCRYRQSFRLNFDFVRFDPENF